MTSLFSGLLTLDKTNRDLKRLDDGACVFRHKNPHEYTYYTCFITVLLLKVTLVHYHSLTNIYLCAKLLADYS